MIVHTDGDSHAGEASPVRLRELYLARFIRLFRHRRVNGQG